MVSEKVGTGVNGRPLRAQAEGAKFCPILKNYTALRQTMVVFRSERCPSLRSLPRYLLTADSSRVSKNSPAADARTRCHTAPRHGVSVVVATTTVRQRKVWAKFELWHREHAIPNNSCTKDGPSAWRTHGLPGSAVLLSHEQEHANHLGLFPAMFSAVRSSGTATKRANSRKCLPTVCIYECIVGAGELSTLRDSRNKQYNSSA